MAEYDLSDALDDCVSRIAAGQTISDCLPRYPQFAEDLRSLLEVGSIIEQIQADSAEVAAAREQVWIRVIPHAKTLTMQQPYYRLAVLAASLVIVLASIAGLAENSLPGDFLYGLKHLTENARSLLIGQQFDVRRIEEIHTLEALKRAADVEFNGHVEQINGTQWVVAGLPMQVGTSTVGAVATAIGQVVHVKARTTERGELVANTITALDPTYIPSPLMSTPDLTSVPTAFPCVPTQPTGWVLYHVHAGDTVSELAYLTGVSAETLISANCIPKSLMILVGQQLFLPFLPQMSTSAATPPASQESSGDTATQHFPSVGNPTASVEAPLASTPVPPVQPTATYHQHWSQEENEDEYDHAEHDDH